MQRLGATLDLLYDFLEEPERGVREVLSRNPVGLGFACFVLAGLSLYLAQQIAAVRPGAGLGGLLLAVSWRVAWGSVLTALLHLLVGMGGPRGSAVSLFVLMGLSDLPWTLAVPGALVLEALAPRSWVLAPALFALLEFSSLVLKARSIRENYGISLARSWALLILAALAGAGFLLLGTLYFSWRVATAALAWFS